MTPLPPAQCVNNFLQEAQRLGIAVRWSREGMDQLDASYQAFPGAPGLVSLSDSTPRPGPQKICTLLTHEMVHVLQHWKGRLTATPPLGWPTHGAPANRKLSLQEAEAYTAQNHPRMVLNAVKKLSPFAF